MSSESLGSVILAAGASSRMGKPKLLLPWQNTTVIGHIIGQWRGLGAYQIAVVHRPDDVALLKELDRLKLPPGDRIENSRPERGMFSSIQCAARWPGWKSTITVWSIILGDQPHLQPETLRTILEFYHRHPEAICQPEYDGHGRHPVLLPREAMDELKNSREQTLKEFLKRTACQSVKCSIEDRGLSLDMDTPADYIRLHHSLNS